MLTPLLRFISFTMLRLLYRPQPAGLENIPRTGGALIVANHQSLIDALLIYRFTGRNVRFLISMEMARRWWVKPFVRATDAIPIERSFTPREIVAALREAHEELARGGLVGIFAEGQVSRTGNVLGFQRGYEKILRGLDVPIIPMAIDGALETPQGFLGNQVRGKTLRLRPTLRLHVGAPLPTHTPPTELRQTIVELLVEAFDRRRHEEVPLHRLALRSLRARPLAKQFADHNTSAPVPNLRVLGAVGALAPVINRLCGDDRAVGVMLPPSLGALAVNLVLAMGGRTSVNLNYTATTTILDEIRQNAEIRRVLTSRLLLEKTRLQLPEGLEPIYMEDVRAQLGGSAKLFGILRGLLMPVGALEKLAGAKKRPHLDDVVTLLYSSGSTGTPKGVPLTHWNVLSNLRAIFLSVRLPADTRLIGVLPLFHSFGYTVAFWLPLVGRVGMTYYPSPLDARAIGYMVARDRITHLFATPTFLAHYTRRVQPWQFGSLRFVLTGAEKLRDSVRDAFESTFGLRVIEGYGCTETSPAIALSAPDARQPLIYQPATRRGAVGVPIPGVAVRVVDVDTGKQLPVGQSGLILVKGPNVMAGYNKRPDLSAKALTDGWYHTGDIGHLDEDGFLYITDRLSRFSKIGGEMVPHGRVEEALQQLAGESDPVFAVAGLPDDKRGERLVVLYALPEKRAREVCEEIAKPEHGFPALWVPRWKDFAPVDEIPILGTGKKDLQRIKQLAEESGV